MSTQAETKTVQQQTKELIAYLVQKTDFTKDELTDLTLQDLQTTADNVSFINKTEDTKVTTNISTEVLQYCIENNLQKLSFSEITEIIRRHNIDNFFDLPANYDNFKKLTLINLDILLNHIKSNRDNKNNADRQKQWLKRAKAYLNSHLIGKTDNTSLYNNKTATHYFEKIGKEYILTSKTHD